MKRYKAGQFAITYQTRMMKKIAQLAGGKEQLLQWIQENLGLGKASAYRRLNGETLFNLEEIVMIIQGFKIPVTELFESHESVQYFYLKNIQPNCYEDWFVGFEKDFAGLSSQPNPILQYTSTETPIFYYFHFDEIAHFKFYIWAKTIWGIEELKDKPFSVNDPMWNDNIKTLKDNFLARYTQIPSIEYWTPNCLSTNLSQIQYFLESYLFEDRSVSLLLCEQLRAMLKMIEAQTKTGFKAPFGEVKKTASFDLYYNEILHTNNTLLFTSDTSQSLFTTFGNPNTIKTQQKSTCDYAATWFEKLRKSSMKISTESDRNRTRLFKMLEDKITKAEKLFSGMI